MTTTSQARTADVRALVGSAALGSILGLAIGGAYLAGGVARISVAHAPLQPPPAALNAPAAGSVASQPQTPAPVAALAAPAKAPPTRIHVVDGLRLVATGLRRQTAKPFHLRGAADRDLECLTQAVYYESRGESTAGQEAVAQVILNRVRHPAFPKTVCGVVYQRTGVSCQFSFACSHVQAPGESAAWDRARHVAQRALNGFVMAEVGNATHFHVAGIGAGWAGGLMKVAQIGAHVFYKFAGHAGRAAMFHGTPEPSAPAEGHPVFASLAPISYGHAGPGFLASTAAVVQHAAAAVEGHLKPATATDAKPAVVASAKPAASSSSQPAAEAKPSAAVQPTPVSAPVKASTVASDSTAAS